MQNSTLSIQTYLHKPKDREMWEDPAVDGIYEHQNGLVAPTTSDGRRTYWKIYCLYNKLLFLRNFKIIQYDIYMKQRLYWTNN